jgi:eukaryotic-like serine/threonine-protein kinase
MSSIADTERIGQLVLGRYRVVRRLAQGGMGVVYLGRLEGAAGFSKPVVIKRIISDPDDQQGSTARFIREAQILSNLQHPGIVGVLDFGEEAELYSMVLEYVQGYDLGRWLKYLQLKAEAMSWEEAVFIVLRVLEALSYAHGFRRNDGTPAEILHRDISPGNILLDVEGRVRLVDFGIARMDASAGDLYKTQTGVLKGKITYMAPELFAGSPPSPASDIYACAIILYQMLAGANPFTAANDSRLMWRVIMEGPPQLSRKRDDLPPELLQVLAKGYERDPARRHASAERFAAELRAMLERSEAELGALLRERLRMDFNGDLPALLRLETLAERDRAWRQDAPAPAPAVVRDALSDATGDAPSVTPATLSEDRSSAASAADAITARASGPARRAPAPLAAPTSARTRGSSWKPVVALGLGMSAALGVAMAGALYYLRPPPVPSEARFIVVEAPEPRAAAEPSPARASTAQPASASDPERPSDPATEQALAGPARAAGLRRGAHSTRSGSGGALSRALARHEQALGACFDRHAAQLEGTPEIAISFEVDPSGAVQSGALVPSALEGTALGRCLLDVARGVSFGRLEKTTRFTIPIHASASR